MTKYYVYGKTIQKMDDLSNVLAIWNGMESMNGYKAVGIENNDGGACDIIVEKNGALVFSKDYQSLGWKIDLDVWTDIFYMIHNNRK